MKSTPSSPVLVICLASLNFCPAGAQSSTDTTLRKNTIKMDITSHWLYRNAVVLSYERVVKANQTFAVTAGKNQFPSVFSFGSTVKVEKDLEASGLKLGGEYRFYLKKENKFNAPHGVYVGPYTTFLTFNNNKFIEVDNNGTLEEGELDTDLQILNIGFQIGYQFVINNRWTVDFAFIGPSVSNYRAKFTLDDDFTFTLDDIQNEIIEGLVERFPGFDDLIKDKEVSSSGRVDTWAYGWRYQLHVGYHFGKKKKKG